MKTRDHEQLGDAAADLVGHISDNSARLVGAVMTDAANVSRRWHGLLFSVTASYIKTAGKVVEEAIKTAHEVVGEAEKRTRY